MAKVLNVKTKLASKNWEASTHKHIGELFKDPIILGIDTSCDETSASIAIGQRIMSNAISSQVALHEKYGGVVPLIAKREHQDHIDPIIEEALSKATATVRRTGNAIAPLTLQDISAVAVTVGPGLAIALEIGIAKAKAICSKYNKPLITVNHMEGHFWSPTGQNSMGTGPYKKVEDVAFPILGILISGGHTELVLSEELGDYSILGETLDDAIGEAFDKVARMLHIGYPGGRTVEQFAKLGNPDNFDLPVPMIGNKTLDFSYSGLKTSAFYKIKKIEEQGELSKQQIYDICASFQRAATKHLSNRILRTLNKFNVKTVLVGGGVASNVFVRRQIRNICSNFGLKPLFPTLSHTSQDNGAMIALVGFQKYLRGEFADHSIDRMPRLKIDQKLK